MFKNKKVHISDIFIMFVILVMLFFFIKGCVTGNGTDLNFGCSNTSIKDTVSVDSTSIK